MAGKICAIVNMKGGVGKTTTTVSLAETLAAKMKKSVLVADFDAQANTTFCLGGRTMMNDLLNRGMTIDAYLGFIGWNERPPALSESVHKGASLLEEKPDIDILASSPHLRFVERELQHRLAKKGYSERGVETQISKPITQGFDKLRRNYDYVLIDCAPGISVLNEVAVKMADMIVAPTIPDYISTLGLAALTKSALAQIKLDGDKVGELWVLATKVMDKNSQHQEFLELLKADAARKDAPFKMFESQIPQLPSLARALQYNEISLPYADKYGDSAKTMEGFAFEFVRRIADAQRR